MAVGWTPPCQGSTATEPDCGRSDLDRARLCYMCDIPPRPNRKQMTRSRATYGHGWTEPGDMEPWSACGGWPQAFKSTEFLDTMKLFKSDLPMCPTHQPCSQWARNYMKYCLCSRKDWISLILGIISVVSWGVAEVPQIITNFKEKSSEGLAIGFLMTWILGDILNVLFNSLLYMKAQRNTNKHEE
ncbi:hypothetical protein L6452_09286 [Arctium lappa]|uniref:Uncharacterized protein n=1 Tax=Arctium lappa TaxID=4217 RepID=A0ACB9DJK0_ARCLA|nr:hypothetical protein L6452_09286 [Arctium lappa]